MAIQKRLAEIFSFVLSVPIIARAYATVGGIFATKQISNESLFIELTSALHIERLSPFSNGSPVLLTKSRPMSSDTVVSSVKHLLYSCIYSKISFHFDLTAVFKDFQGFSMTGRSFFLLHFLGQ